MNGISISDMKDFATDFGSDLQLGNDIGNVIDLNDLGSDDLGMSFLANTNIGGSSSRNRDQSSSYNVAPSASINNIELQPLDSFGGIEELNIPLADGSIPSVTFTKEESIFGNNQSSSATNIQFQSAARIDPEEERRLKADLITKLDRLEKRGYPVSKRFTVDNTLQEIQDEYNRLTDARSLETSIKFQRQMMMGLVTGLEMMNEKVVPDRLKANIDGWSESVHENVEDFDEVFEELYDKYKGKGNMPPEARLIFMLAGSGFMYHMSNSFMRKNMPTADEVFKNNPQLRRDFASAMAQQAGPGFGNFMEMSMPGGQQQPQPAMQQMQQMGGAQFGGQNGAFYQSPQQPVTAMPSVQMPQQFAAAEPPRVARKEMNGPSGVDDILNVFKEVRDAEVGGFMNRPPTPPPSPGAHSQMYAQPVISALNEMQSVGSDDFASRADSTMTGRTRGTAARRKAMPIGNVLNLNV
jgi:hypothetical protein